MKKMVLTLLTSVFLCLAITVYAQSRTVAVGDESQILCVAHRGDTLYLLTDTGGIYGLTLGDHVAQELMQGGTASKKRDTINGILCLPNGLYGMQAGSGTLRQLLTPDDERPENPDEIALSASGEWDRNYAQFLQATEDAIYFCLYSLDTNSSVICRYDMGSGALSQRDLKNVDSFCVYKEDKLFVTQQQDRDKVLSVFDWNTKSLQKIDSFSQEIRGLYYNAAQDELLFTSGKELYKIKNFSAREKVASFPFVNLLTHGAILNNEIYVGGSAGGFAYLFDLSMEKADETLIVLGERPASSGYKAFVMENPNVTVDISGSPYEYQDTERFIQGLLTGILAFDVMRVSTSYFDVQLLIKKGYCENLSGSSVLLEKIEDMYPRIREAAFYQGQLYAAPCSVGTEDWEIYYPNAWNDAGFSSDDLPKTFGGYLDFLANWKSQATDVQANYVIMESDDIRKSLIHMLMKRYISQYRFSGELLTFDTPLFREMLRKVNATADILHSNSVKPGEGAYLFGAASSDILHEPLLSLPLSQKESDLICANLDVYFINPRSDNKELAMRYIESCILNPGEKEEITLYPSAATPIERTGFSKRIADWEEGKKLLKAQLEQENNGANKKAMEDALARHELEYNVIEKTQYEVSPEMIRTYHDTVAPHLYFPGPSMFSQDTGNGRLLDEIVNRYLAGKENEDRFIDTLEQKVRMMQLENED